VVISAGTAFARGGDHYDRGHHYNRWDRNNPHDRWNNRNQHRWDNHRGSRNTIIITSGYRPPVYHYVAPVYVSAPAYVPTQRVSRTVCRERDNTLPILLGGAGGGILGHQVGKGRGNTAATIAGTLIGATIASSYSSGRDCYEQVFETAPVGAPVSFQTAQANYNYTITPTRNYETDGRYCREYQATATVGGRYQETYGTACRQPDGQWEVVN
jgi:surface antigen